MCFFHSFSQIFFWNFFFRKTFLILLFKNHFWPKIFLMGPLYTCLVIACTILFLGPSWLWKVPASSNNQSSWQQSVWSFDIVWFTCDWFIEPLLHEQWRFRAEKTSRTWEYGCFYNVLHIPRNIFNRLLCWNLLIIWETVGLV